MEEEQKEHEEIAEKMSRSFDALACTAVTKSEMLDNHTTTTTTKSLPDIVTELTATNKKLVNQLVAALVTCVKPPPGLTNPTPSSPLATTSGHILTSADGTCPAKLES